MISKAKVKSIKLLHQKKYRDAEGLFIAEGPKVVNDLLASDFTAKEVFALKGFRPALAGVKVQEVSEAELSSMSALAAPNQVLATFETKYPGADSAALKDGLVLALDNIRDPGNLGTIIRIADWFGVGHVLCSESSADIYNPKVVQATMGSLARVKVYYVDLDSVLKEFTDVYAAVLDGDSVYKKKLSDKGVLLIGNEANGISDSLLKRVKHRITIPSFSPGADSLNAAVATAVICSEFRRG